MSPGETSRVEDGGSASFHTLLGMWRLTQWLAVWLAVTMQLLSEGELASIYGYRRDLGKK